MMRGFTQLAQIAFAMRFMRGCISRRLAPSKETPSRLKTHCHWVAFLCEQARLGHHHDPQADDALHCWPHSGCRYWKPCAARTSQSTVSDTAISVFNNEAEHRSEERRVGKE